MGKMYTFDNKLLVEKPEIRIGDKCYPVDDRTSTVKKLMKEIRAVKEDSEEIIDTDEMIIRAAFGKNAKEILNMELSFKAMSELSQMAMSAMTGDEYTPDDRFQKEQEQPAD